MNVIDVPFVRANGDFSLREVFAEGACIENLSGSPAERLMMIKFLSALCLAACRPQTRKEIEALTNDNLARRVCEYLACRHELFEFEGDEPFLQYPAAVKAQEVILNEFLRSE